jgi:L-alanine-DL-glutamate epimerase-like enolase superfamily enzyme
MVDANQGWTFAHAARAIRAFEPLAITWVEEPLLCDDIEGYGRLRQLATSPIAGGENVYTLHQFQQYLARGGLDFVQADVVRVGGITPYMEIAALARAYNLPMAPHFMMEISGQVLCTLANGHILENIDGGSLTDLKALRPGAPAIVDGYFSPGDKTGHGLEFDLDYLEQHQISP